MSSEVSKIQDYNSDEQVNSANNNDQPHTPLPPQKQSKKPGIGERDTEVFPEGGRGWLVIAGSFVALGQTYGLINSFGQYQVEYETLYPEVKSEIISLVGSLQPFIVNLTSIIAIVINKRKGPRFAMTLSGLVISFGFMMLSLANEIWQVFLTQGLLIGFGMGICCFTAFAIPQQWFKNKRALAVGIVASGSSVGGMLWPIAVSRLTKQVGMDWTNRIVGFIYLPLFAFSALAIKSRTVATDAGSSPPKPQDLESKLPDLRIKTTLEKVYTHNSETIADELAEEIGLEPEQHKQQIQDQQSSLPPKKYLGIFHKNFLLDWTVMNDFSFCIFLIGSFLSFLGVFPPLFYLPSYCRRINLSPNIYEYILTIANAASLFGRIVPGYMGDHIGRLNALIPFVALSGITIFVFWMPSQSAALTIVFAVTYGAASGSVISLFSSAIGQLFGLKGLPSRLTMLFITNSVPSLIGPVIAGSFIPNDTNLGDAGFSKLMIFSGVCFLASAGFLIYLRISISKKLFVFV